MSPAPIESITTGELLRAGGELEALNPQDFADSQLDSELNIEPNVDARIESFLASKGVTRGLGQSAMANILSLEI